MGATPPRIPGRKQASQPGAPAKGRKPKSLDSASRDSVQSAQDPMTVSNQRVSDQFQSFQVLPLRHPHVEVRKADETSDKVCKACLVFQDPPDGGVVGEYVLRFAEESVQTKDAFPPLVIGPGT